MAQKRDRIFALVMAITFAITTIGVSAAFVWQVVQESRKDKTTTSEQTAVDTNTDNKETTKLEGTNMKDFTTVAKVDELQITDPTAGTGDVVEAGDTVTVDYTGALASTGVIFQSSLDTGDTVTFSLDGVIAGWTQGVPGMKVGGTRRLLIPAALAYGGQSKPGIPPNSDLVFDITLHAIAK